MVKRSLVAATLAGLFAASSAQAAQPVQLSVGGFLYSAFTVQATYEDGGRTFDATSLRQDGVIAFSGDTVLDNGLKVGAVASLEFMNNGGFGGAYSIDRGVEVEELYASVGGSFGDVYVGQRRNAASLTHVFIPTAGLPNMGVDDSRLSSFVGGATTTAASLDVAGEYAARVQYFTPRIAGLQLAASYAADANRANDFRNGINPYRSGQLKNEVSLGANYTHQFGPVSWHGSAGLTMAEVQAGGIGVLNNDPYGFQFGGALKYAGFTLGGAYGQVNFNAVDDQRYGAGLRYETGPWTFGGSWLQRRITGGGLVSQAAVASAYGPAGMTARGVQLARTMDFFEVGGSYALGPGVTAGAAVYYNDNRRVIGGAKGADSLAGAVALGLKF